MIQRAEKLAEHIPYFKEASAKREKESARLEGEDRR